MHGVERVAREALLLDEADDSAEDVSCGVLALHCKSIEAGDNDGGVIKNNKCSGDADEGEFAVMVGIGATSPFLHRDELYCCDTDDYHPPNDDHIIGATTTYLPLSIYESTKSSQPEATTTISDITTPLSILSPTLIVGVGGKAIDSIILLRRTIEVALSIYSNDNGGVDWFVSHSLEGMEEEERKSFQSPSWRPIMGGTAGVDVTSLVRRVADMAQSSTQSLGGRYGRMLSVSFFVGSQADIDILYLNIYHYACSYLFCAQSSLLAVGSRKPSNSDSDTLILWRVDPTGQFWRLGASAVGRGALLVESELLSLMKKRKRLETEQHNDEEEEDTECDILHEDIRSFLGSLSVEEAVDVATDCFVNGIMKSVQKKLGSRKNENDMRQLEQGLRKRVQAIVIRSNALGQPRIEIV